MVQTRVTRIGYRVSMIELEMVIRLGLPLLNYTAPVQKQIIGFEEMSL